MELQRHVVTQHTQPDPSTQRLASQTGKCAQLSWKQTLIWWYSVFSYLVWLEPRWLMWQQTWLREAACCVDGLLHSIIRWRGVCVIDCPSWYAFLHCARECVFKILLLYWITWLVRKCLPVCVFVLLGRLPSCTEKTDHCICNIQISSREEKKTKKRYCGESEKMSIWFGSGSAALYAHCRQHFLCRLIFYSAPPTHLRDIWEEWYMSFSLQ